MSTFAHYGFRDIAERTKLAKVAAVERLLPADTNNLSTPERLRLAFEALGPTFIKMGQILSTRPDLIPSEFADEFSKLQNQVTALPYEEIELTLKSHFGQSFDRIFSEFDRSAIAAGSVAQVHMARLQSGEKVVVKVQRPKIEDTISEDMGVLYLLAELIEKYIPESRIYRPLAVIDEFARALELELNFIIEANNIRRFQENFANEPNIKIPHVHNDLSGKRVLVMEALDGIPLSQKNALQQEGIDPEKVLRVGLRCYLKMVFSDGLFHGDLHAGNMFVLPNNRIGLIDFGVVGRLNKKTQSAIANMLVALAGEDYDRLAYEYVDLAPYSEHVDVDLFARDLRDLIAPYYGLTLKHVNVGRLLMDSTALAARYGLQMPSELIMYFKSIVAIEGMGRVVMKDFNFLAYSLEFAAELVQSRAEPTRVIRELGTVGRDLNSLISTLPRQIKQLLRRLSSPDFSVRMRVEELHEIRQGLKNAANTIFLGVVIGCLLLSASILLHIKDTPTILGFPALSAIHYAFAMLLGLFAFINYIRK